MANAVAANLLAAACADFAAVRSSLSPMMPVAAVERVAFTHALWCGTCRPLADQVRREQAARTQQLAAAARADGARAAGAPRVRGVEGFLAEAVDAPSVAAWSSYPGNGQRQAIDLLRDTADALRATPRPA
jgi:hypothetical protein